MWGSFSNVTEELPATGIYVLMQKTSKGGVSEQFTVLGILPSIHV